MHVRVHTNVTRVPTKTNLKTQSLAKRQAWRTCVLYTMWLLIVLFVLSTYAQDAPRVTIEQGVIIGSRALDGDYLTFYGIHYGGSTAGANRFKVTRFAVYLYNYVIIFIV